MEKDSYSEQLNRLHEEQEKAIKETDKRISQWQTFQSDYEALKDQLKTLPNKLSHDVMVPFGKMAFMPGQLVHTNEILVLLGDNWFVERSAKQAAEIVERRVKSVDDQLEELFKQRKLLEPRRGFTEELQGMTQGSDGVMDIREEYNEEKEKRWRVTHKKNVQKHRRHLKKRQTEDQSSIGSSQSKMTDEELWERLDQLEKIELKGSEMQKVGRTTEDDSSFPLDLPWTDKTGEKETSSRLGGTNEYSQDSSAEELDSDDDEDEEEEEVEEVIGRGKVINFHHTKTQLLSELGDTAASSSLGDRDIERPSDIYTKFSSCFGPRSILKGKTEHKKQRQKKRNERKVAFETGGSEKETKTEAKQISSEKTLPQQTAFSGTVVEKPLPNISPRQPVAEIPVPKEPKVVLERPEPDVKPVSKFKAQRLGKSVR